MAQNNERWDHEELRAEVDREVELLLVGVSCLTPEEKDCVLSGGGR